MNAITQKPIVTPAEKAEKKALQAIDRAQAMRDYVAEGLATRDKTERLRQERLARSAAKAK